MEELVINQALEEHVAWEVGGLSYLQAEHTIKISCYPFLYCEAKFPSGRNGWGKEP